MMFPSPVLLDGVIFVCVTMFVLGLVPYVWQPRPHVIGLSKPLLAVESVSNIRKLTAPLTLVGRLLAGTGEQVERLRAMLAYVGSRLTVEEFAGVKVLAIIVGCIVAAVLSHEIGGISPLWLGIGGILGFLAPDLWLRSVVAQRQKAILRVLPEVIDLMALCVGAGLDFLGAINRVLLIKAFKKEPFIQELSMVLQEVKLGKRRSESLKALAKRVNLPEINSFVRTLVQADRMGTPISEALAVHSEDMRIQRFIRAERAALKAPLKILIPLIFCIMPCIGLIIGGPIFMQFLSQGPLIGK